MACKMKQRWASRCREVSLLMLLGVYSLSINGMSLTTQTMQAQESVATKTEYPKITKMIPEIGATDVDSGLKEIRVTFDRKMDGGMSWTGGPPLFPPKDADRQAQWLDDQTCILPVKLESGHFYRLSLNSKSFQNFKSVEGTALPPVILYFVTAGSDSEITKRARVPKVVDLEPNKGAESVDPSRTELRITFDVPMGEGMSWTGGGETFPKLTPGQSAVWSKDKKQCTLPVKLEPGRTYRLGINSLHHQNFQSEWGVPAAPVEYFFTTAK